MRNIFFIFLPALVGLTGNAQSDKIDSLKKAAESGVSDTGTVNALNQLSISNWRTGEYKTAFEQAEKALVIATKLQWQSGISIALDNRGTINWYKGNYPEALKDHLASLKIRESQGDPSRIAVSYNNIAGDYLYQNNFDEALRYYRDAQKIFETKCGQGSSADMKCLQGLAASHNNLGNVYYSMGNMKEALACFTKSLEIRKKTGVKGDIATSYNNLGILYDEAGDVKHAMENYTTALKLMEEIGDKESICGFYINVGSFFTRIKKYADARTYLTKALSIANEIGSPLERKECYADLAVLDSSAGNFAGALSWYKLFIGARDSLVNEENTKKTVRLEMNYQFEKKEATAKLEQEKKDALAAAESRKQRIILFSVSGFGLLVLGFALFAYRSYLQKQRANIEISRQKSLIEEKQTEILDSIHYAKRIQTALMPREKYIARVLKELKS